VIVIADELFIKEDDGYKIDIKIVFNKRGEIIEEVIDKINFIGKIFAFKFISEIKNEWTFRETENNNNIIVIAIINFM
jgi:hypothetical protein